MSGERDAIRVALKAAAARLPLGPWVTPELLAGVVEGVMVKAGLALAFEPRRVRVKALAAEIGAVRFALQKLAVTVEGLSPEAEAEIRFARLRLGHPDSSLGLAVDRLDAEAASAVERLTADSKPERPALPEAAIGIALVGAFERLTGRRATFTTSPADSAVTGPAVAFVRDGLAALAIEGSAQVVLRAARDRRREAADRRERSRAETAAAVDSAARVRESKT